MPDIETASEEFRAWNKDMVDSWNEWVGAAPWEFLSPAERAIIDKLGDTWLVIRQQGLEIDLLKQRINELEKG